MSTTILLADDSITIQKVVGIIFANEEYDLVVVDNGSSALEKAREIRPAVMLVDAIMPGKSGYEVCEEVRRDPVLGSTPLLLLVGAFEPFEEDRARTSGADDFITKPFESQNLIEKVRILVDLGVSRSLRLPLTMEEPQEEIELSLADQEIPSAVQPFAPAESFAAFVHPGGDVTPVREAVAAELAEPMPEPEVASSVEPESHGVILLSSVDIVEASPEDDLWGAFAEEVTEGEVVQFGEMVEEAGPEILSPTVEEIEPYTLTEEEPCAVSFAEEPVSEVIESDSIQESTFGYDTFAVTGREERPVFEEPPESPDNNQTTSERIEESFGVRESISLGVEPETVLPESSAQICEPIISPVESSEPCSFVQEDVDLQFAPEDEYVLAAEAFAVPEDVPAAVGEEIPVSTVEGATIAVSEAQLADALSRISREIIEKIAWEVVPDLAETIIREEIRKIKEGMVR